jgi:hypothetical protein
MLAALLLLAMEWFAGPKSNAAEMGSFQAGTGSGWHLGTLGAGNLDGDALLEIVVPYRDASGQWFLDAFKPNGVRLPGFPYLGGGEEINVSPTLYDLDNDGRDEIIFTHGHRVIALRGDGSIVWSNAVTRANYVPDGGYMTVTNGFYWSKGGEFLSRLPTNAVFSSQVASPMVADINGDGVSEIVTGWKIDPEEGGPYQDFNPFINDIWGSAEWGTAGETWSGGVVFFNAANGVMDYRYHLHQLVESGLAFGQSDHDKALEVYVLNDSDSVACFDKTRQHDLFGNGTLHQQFGKNQRLMSGAYQQGVDVYTVDLDGDGRSEVLVPTTQLNTRWQPSETILAHDGAILWREWKKPLTATLDQWLNNACMIPLNPDRDNHIDVLSFTHSSEISFRYWNGVELVDRPGWPKDFAPYLPTPPVVGDVDGDGAEEIVIGTYHPGRNPSDGTLYVFNLNGTLQTSLPVAGGLKHIPTLADVNANGGLEVIYRSLPGRIYIQSFGATRSTPVSWATHRGSRHRDGNFGLSLFPPGTPLLKDRESGQRWASFSWKGDDTNTVREWRILRAEQPQGPFTRLATLSANIMSYRDESLSPGCQYLYEIAAVYPTSTVHSAPFALLSSLNGNLVSNGGFEENDNSHWDKWFTGEIDWNDMTVTTNVAHQGRKSMEISLVNKGGNGSISQFGQYGTPDACLRVSPGRLYSFGGFFRSGGLTRSSQHWLEWASTKTGEDTNDRPARLYPNYFTPPLAIGTGPTAWTYANRTFSLPAGFPNVELGHRYTITAPGSGSIFIDDVFFRPLPPLAATNWIEVIPFGSPWRFATGTVPANWFATNFNDAPWLPGFAKFGSGSGPTNIATPLPQKKPGYYFRRNFVMPAFPCEELLLSATCTDGGGKSPEIYLNGVRLVTSGIDVVTGQGNEVRYYDLTPLAQLLRPGTNSIAVLLHNIWESSWDDVAFDLSLKTIPVPSPSAHFSAITSVSALPLGLQEIRLDLALPPNSVWRVESTDALNPAQWQLVDRATNNPLVPVLIRDTGQRGRLPPAQTSRRFYRLVPN